MWSILVNCGYKNNEIRDIVHVEHYGEDVPRVQPIVEQVNGFETTYEMSNYYHLDTSKEMKGHKLVLNHQNLLVMCSMLYMRIHYLN